MSNESTSEPLTPEQLAELRRVAERERENAADGLDYYRFHPGDVLRLLDMVERQEKELRHLRSDFNTLAESAERIRAEEREACAKVADQALIDEGETIAAWIAETIRARGGDR